MTARPLPSLRIPGEARSAALGWCALAARKGSTVDEIRADLVTLGLLPKPRRTGRRECGHDASEVRRDNARRGFYCLGCQREKRAAAKGGAA